MVGAAQPALKFLHCFNYGVRGGHLSPYFSSHRSNQIDETSLVYKSVPSKQPRFLPQQKRKCKNNSSKSDFNNLVNGHRKSNINDRIDIQIMCDTLISPSLYLIILMVVWTIVYDLLFVLKYQQRVQSVGIR